MGNFQFSKYMKNFQFSKYCTPAQLYLALGTIGIIGAFFNNYSIETLLTNALFLVVWAWVLNWLCSKGFKVISWILVLLPFVFFLFMYFLAKDVVREGLNEPKVNMDRIIDRIDREGPESSASKPPSSNPSSSNPSSKPAPANSDDEGNRGNNAQPGGKAQPGSNSSATPVMTEREKQERQAKIDKAVADEQAKIDAGIKADQKKQWDDLKAKSAADEAAAKAARAAKNAGGNAGSANDTLHDNTAAGIAKRGGITVGSQVVTTINPVAGAVYDYFSESWLLASFARFLISLA